jgi:hypothetical protein
MSPLKCIVILGLIGPAGRADEPRRAPRAPATVFEGVWHESVPPGTSDELKVTISFVGDDVTINLYGQTLRGTFTHSAGRPLPVISFDVESADGTRQHIPGVYELEKDRLSLKIGPEEVVAPANNDPTARVIRVAGSVSQLGRAPLVLTLEKAKK